MNNKLVSIITPCYNGEAFAERFFQNILEQTYPNIELIFINDGSSDRTDQIAKSYIDQFEQKGKKLIYIYQNNAGQAAAVNKGLEVFTGEYLMWTDSDDILDLDNVEKKVAFLEKYPEYGFVMCRGRVVREGCLDVKIGELKRIPPKGEDTFFRDMILEKNVVFTPGVYMARSEAVLKAIPTRHIYESRVGQNWQMLLPLSYHYKCGYMKEELFSYVIREESHSRQEKSLDEVLEKLHNHDETLKVILKEMGLEKSEYMDMLKDKLIRKEFDNAYHYKNAALLKEKYVQLKQMNKATKRDTLIYLAGNYVIVDWLYSIFKMVKEWRRRRK